VAAAPPATPAQPAEPAPAAPSASADQLDSGDGDDSGGSSGGAAAPKSKKSLKEIGKRGDSKVTELAERADPFAPPSARPPPPPPPKESATATPVASSVDASKNPSPERAARDGVSENWEETEDEGATARPVAEVAAEGEPGASGRLVYSRDWLRSRANLPPCQVRPPGLDEETCPYAQEILMSSPRLLEAYDPAAAREAMGRRGPPGGGRGGGGGGGGGDDWGARRGDRFQDPRAMGGRGGMDGGRGGRGGGDRRGGADDKWERRGPPPPPSPGARGARGGLPALHRAENRFVAGKSQSEDPEEEKRQKNFQGILNKITPDNFERLTTRIIEEVGIKEQRTLEGLIDKIFDKALTDTHFSELYANMCKVVSAHKETPKFRNPEGGKDIDFRRLLLNKCQEEFEKGSKAMDNVAEREKKEAEDGDPAEGDKPKEDAGEEREEGEITPPATPVAEMTEAERKRAERQAAQADVAARRRMLGNIQFIGYLFKFGLLTERILHSCVTQLLKEESSPRPEDVECLCKLMTTVGGQLDNTQKPELKQAMRVYFDRMLRLKDNAKLENRIKFMIQDVLDLRASRWVPRTKKEGPKKISDIHREASQELAAQAARDADERRRGGGRDRGPMPAPQRPGYDRMLDKNDMPNRALQMQRAPSSEMQLRPGGAFGRARNASPAAVQQPPPPAPRGAPAAAAAAAPERVPTPPPCAAPAMSAGEMKNATITIIESFHQTSPPKAEVILEGLADLRSRGADMSGVLSPLLVAALNHRGINVEERLTLVLPALTAAVEKGAEGGLAAPEFEAGAVALCRELHNLVEDLPKAPKLLGPFLGAFVAAGATSLGALLGAILDVEPLPSGDDGEESTDPPLVAAGHAHEVLFGVVRALKEAKGEEAAVAAWKDSKLDATKFFDEFGRDMAGEDCAKAGLPFLAPA